MKKRYCVWDQDRIDKFIKLYPITSIEEMSLIFGLGKESVLQRAYEYKVKTLSSRYWTKEKIEKFVLLYPTSSIEDMKEIFNIGEDSVRSKACEFNIKKYNPAIYTKDQKKFIKENYNKIPITEIADTLGKSYFSLTTEAGRLGCKTRSKWSDEEIKIIYDNYATCTNKYIHDNFLPNRKIESIRTMGAKLGIKKAKNTMVKYDMDEVIYNLGVVYAELGRAPFGRELIEFGLPSEKTFTRHFGGYQELCRKLGYEGSHAIFGKSYSTESNGGIKCNSMCEQKITNFLEENNIYFTKENYYKDFINDDRCGNKRFDWVINENIFVEYFGMPEKVSYKKRIDEKISICNDNNIDLICIYEKDLKNLHKIFNINP